MKRALILFLFAASPALAADPPTLVMPTALMAGLVQYLGHKHADGSSLPFDEVAPFLTEIQACVAAQVPDDRGVIISRGGCQAVVAALNSKTDDKKDDTKKPTDPPAAH